MKLLGACTAAFLVGMAGVAQVTPAGALEDVLALLGTMPVEQRLKDTLASALRDAVPAGRVSPPVVLAYLERAGALPPSEAGKALQILSTGLEAGLLVDRLMNEGLKGWAMTRSWEVILEMLSMRLRLLVAAQEAIAGVHAGPWICPATLRQVVLETGWAVGDHIVEGGSLADSAGMTSRVHQRLARLRGAAPCETTVDALLEALTPGMVQGIATRALAENRR